MKWVELIELRSIDKNRDMLKSELQKLIHSVDKQRKHQVIMAYRRVLIDTDFCIHILHDSNKVDNNGSQLGLRLASALKAFGLVNHSIWIEIHNKYFSL
ncbi:MAG: hypothetical protein PVI06_20880 [Desulfobacterales bacterium]|jgi:hypothetical protein